MGDVKTASFRAGLLSTKLLTNNKILNKNKIIIKLLTHCGAGSACPFIKK